MFELTLKNEIEFKEMAIYDDNMYDKNILLHLFKTKLNTLTFNTTD